METKILPVKFEFAGIRVLSVAPHTTAAGLGLVVGDLLASVAGRRVADVAAVTAALQMVRAGELVRAHWLRAGRLMCADARAQVIGPGGVINTGVVLGASLGVTERELVTQVHASNRGLSDVQAAMLDWSAQAFEHGLLQRWGGVVAGVVGGLGVAFAASRLLRPRALSPATRRAIEGS